MDVSAKYHIRTCNLSKHDSVIYKHWQKQPTASHHTDKFINNK